MGRQGKRADVHPLAIVPPQRVSLDALAQTSQVIVVTHLAQVAAFANNHLHVVKDTDGQVTTSSVTRLQGEERVRELARMLGGMEDSHSALTHAKELLEQTHSVSRR